MEQAGSEAWADPEFVGDLRTWFREDNNAEDGITPGAFNIAKPAVAILKAAFRRGGFKSRTMRHAMATSEVQALQSALLSRYLELKTDRLKPYF